MGCRQNPPRIHVVRRPSVVCGRMGPRGRGEAGAHPRKRCGGPCGRDRPGLQAGDAGWPDGSVQEAALHGLRAWTRRDDPRHRMREAGPRRREDAGKGLQVHDTAFLLVGKLFEAFLGARMLPVHRPPDPFKIGGQAVPPPAFHTPGPPPSGIRLAIPASGLRRDGTVHGEDRRDPGNRSGGAVGNRRLESEEGSTWPRA